MLAAKVGTEDFCQGGHLPAGGRYFRGAARGELVFFLAPVDLGSWLWRFQHSRTR